RPGRTKRKRSSQLIRQLPRGAGRNGRGLSRQLIVETLPEALGPALNDLSVADPVDVQLTQRHSLSRRRDAEVLARVRSLGRGAGRNEVALRQDDLDGRANVGEPATNDAE